MPFFAFDQQESIARTGFYVSFFSYGLFWMLDLLRPGFVARFFSVHIFLLGVIVFGIWWGAVVEEYADSPVMQHGVAFLCGILLAVLVWSAGDAFGVWRFPVSLVACGLPLLYIRLVKYK